MKKTWNQIKKEKKRLIRTERIDRMLIPLGRWIVGFCVFYTIFHLITLTW